MSPSRPCALSWLRVERYALGELSPVDAQAIEAHLATCAACAAMVATIEGDRRPLPPLQLPEPAWWQRLPAPVFAGAYGMLVAATLSMMHTHAEPFVYFQF